MDLNFDYQKYIEQLPGLATEYGTKIALAVLIFVVGRIVARMVSNLIEKSLVKSKVEPTVSSFVKNLVYGGLYAFVIIAMLSQIGIQTASFVAIIGAAGLAVGLALQGSLSNFAAGVLMVLFKPCKVGDFIDAAGVSGSVDEITIFCTRLTTPDNKIIIVPNAAIMDGNITNYSAAATRRVDLVIGVGYDADLQQTKEVLQKTVLADARVLRDQAVTVAVSELGDSSVNFVVRPWVNSSDYWPTYFDLLENIKNALDNANINIPYPQVDLHVVKETADIETA